MNVDGDSQVSVRCLSGRNRVTVGRWQPDRHPMSPDIVVVFLFIYLFAVISSLNDYLYFAFILFSFFFKKIIKSIATNAVRRSSF